MRLGRLGVNIGTDPIFAPADLAAHGFNLARIVLQRHVPLHDYLARCHQQDIHVLGVITRDSLAVRDGDQIVGEMSFGEAARLYAAEYANGLDYWQIGNESDHDPTGPNDGSWSMPPAECSRLIQTFVAAIRAERENAYISGPGLVSGQPGYLRQVNLAGLNAIAVHPYDQTPASAKVLFEHNYGEWLERGMRIFITEFGLPDPDPEVRGTHLQEMVEQFRQLEYVEAAIWYCWARVQHPRPFFVVDYDQDTLIPTPLCDIARTFGFVEPIAV